MQHCSNNYIHSETTNICILFLLYCNNISIKKNSKLSIILKKNKKPKLLKNANKTKNSKYYIIKRITSNNITSNNFINNIIPTKNDSFELIFSDEKIANWIFNLIQNWLVDSNSIILLSLQIQITFHLA